MKKFRLGFRILVASSLFYLTSAQGADQPVVLSNISLRNEVQMAIGRGVESLISSQNPAGYWTTPDHPAITALALVALEGNKPGAKEKEALQKGFAFLETCFQPDGSIHNNKGTVNYNTSICLMALLASKDPKYKDQIRKTHDFLIGTQVDIGEKGKIDSAFDGGVGYYHDSNHSDLANTIHALEAIYYSNQYLKAEKAESAPKDLNWKAAINFVQNCQNLSGYNKEAWVLDEPQKDGGFIYYPGKSEAPDIKLPNGRTALRTYGSISYAGLLSYVYADLKRDDPRVRAVLSWLEHNYSINENPGLGPQGLYYYYLTMAKGLSAAGVDELTVNGEKVKWREQLAKQLLNLQHSDGSWVNENGRWREKEPALVTAYGVMTLEFTSANL